MPGMAYREFIDTNGTSWRVWSTVPSAGSRLHGGFDQGWLTFERTSPEAGKSNLRRLCPIPADWEGASDNVLALMCRSAEEVVRPATVREQAAREQARPAESPEPHQ